jgi:ribosome maturation factor RimP
MITSEKILSVVEEYLSDSGVFPVEVKIRAGNRIQVFLDGPKGIDVGLCAQLNRFIESHFDREVEDYELEVSSAGLDMPLRIPRQFEKNKGKTVDVLSGTGEKWKGVLGESDEEGFLLHTEKLVKGIDPETGKRKKILEKSTLRCLYAEIKSVKLVISFHLEEKSE